MLKPKSEEWAGVCAGGPIGWRCGRCLMAVWQVCASGWPPPLPCPRPSSEPPRPCGRLRQVRAAGAPGGAAQRLSRCTGGGERPSNARTADVLSRRNRSVDIVGLNWLPPSASDVDIVFVQIKCPRKTWHEWYAFRSAWPNPLCNIFVVPERATHKYRLTSLQVAPLRANFVRTLGPVALAPSWPNPGQI